MSPLGVSSLPPVPTTKLLIGLGRLAKPLVSVDAEARVEALVYQGMVRLIEQLVEEDRGARVSEPAAH
jgi:hypothetical protein